MRLEAELGTLGAIGNWDAVEIADRIRSGDLSAVEVVESCLRSIEAAEPRLGAFVHLDPEAALAEARESPSGPLAGVPFAVKDAIGYPGMPWAMGSRLLAGNTASEHSAYTAALRRAGLVTLGKTATSELALLGSTETLLAGATRNPWGEGLSAAGSSGGAAAAVAAGLVPLAHASDGGGSIRVPASVCGVFGFKPTNGRTQPTLPGGGLDDLLVDHCISRSVRDSARLLAATERVDRDTPLAPVGVVSQPLGGVLRIAVWRSTLLGESPSPEVDGALDDTMKLCAGLGHHVEEITPPPIDGAAVSDGFFTLAGAAVERLAQTMAPVLGRPVGSEDLEPFTLELRDWYLGLPEGKRRMATATLEGAGALYRSVFEQWDVVLTPTLATTPWPLGHLAPTLGREELVRRTEQSVGYTPIHNIAGCPAMSVPVGWSDAGLPIGSHFAGPPGEDARLLSLAFQLEDARPWRDIRPRRPSVTAS